jgi:hypothetical protein
MKMPPKGRLFYLSLEELEMQSHLRPKAEGFDKFVWNEFGRCSEAKAPEGQKPGWFLTIPLPQP